MGVAGFFGEFCGVFFGIGLGGERDGVVFSSFLVIERRGGHVGRALVVNGLALRVLLGEH